MTTIRTVVRITGVFDPDVVTRELSLAPTRTWRAGDVRAGGARYRQDGWTLVIGSRPALHVDAELAEAVSVLRPHAAWFREVAPARGLRAMLGFDVDVDEGQLPSISLEPGLIAELAELGVSFYVDIV